MRDRAKRREIWIRSFVLAMAAYLASSVAFAAPVTVRFNYRGGNEQRESLVNEWISTFEAQHPEINIEWEEAGAGWQNKLQVEMAAGTAPDVTELWGEFAQNLAQSGALLDLRPYVEKYMPQSQIEGFFPASWNSTFLKYGPRKGMQFSMPGYLNTIVFFYNADHFQETGIPSPQALAEGGNWTWETLRESAKKLTRSDGDVISQYGFSSLSTLQWVRFSQWLWAAGGDWFDPNDPTRFIGDRPEAARAAEFLHDMIWTDQSTRIGFSINNFVDGSTSMIEEGVGAIFTNIKPNVGDTFEWDLVKRPSGPAGQGAMVADDGFAIWSGTKVPDEAFKFVQFLVSVEGQEILARRAGLAPVQRDATQTYVELDPVHNLGVFAETALAAQPLMTTRISGNLGVIGPALQEALQKYVYRNEAPFEVAVNEAKSAVEGAIIRD